MHIGFWWVDLREGDHLEDLGIDGSIRGGIGKHGLGCSSDRWRALVNAVVNLRAP